jgi:hypothetical protein
MRTLDEARCSIRLSTPPRLVAREGCAQATTVMAFFAPAPETTAGRRTSRIWRQASACAGCVSDRESHRLDAVAAEPRHAHRVRGLRVRARAAARRGDQQSNGEERRRLMQIAQPVASGARARSAAERRVPPDIRRAVHHEISPSATDSRTGCRWCCCRPSGAPRSCAAGQRRDIADLRKGFGVSTQRRRAR